MDERIEENAVKFLTLLVIALLVPFVANALELELGLPIKRVNGVEATIVRVNSGECWNHGDGLCIYPGVLFTEVDIDGGENVRFLGADIFARFNGGPYWSRIGFGFGFFDRKTDEIRSAWDFNLSVQYGARMSKSMGGYVGWEHWSNGRSFAEKLGLKSLWPDHNDGGNAFIIGIVVKI